MYEELHVRRLSEANVRTKSASLDPNQDPKHGTSVPMVSKRNQKRVTLCFRIKEKFWTQWEGKEGEGISSRKYRRSCNRRCDEQWTGGCGTNKESVLWTQQGNCIH